MLKNIIKTIKNTWLCLKYPFLYPRSRYTDKHYTNRVINNKIFELRTEYLLPMSVTIMTDEEFSSALDKIKEENDKGNKHVEISKSIDFNKYHLSLWRDGHYAFIGIERNNRVSYYEFDINDYLDRTNLTSNDIEGVFFRFTKTKLYMGHFEQTVQIVFVLKNGENKTFPCPSFKLINVDLLGYTHAYIKLLEWINDFLGWFHVLPSYTELDEMDDGWRIKFGEDMCREIRNSLLTTYIRNEKHDSLFGKIKAYYKGVKLLLSYRILQIKEKFGSLRWYANGDTEDTLKIIDKYEKISKRTCVICGKEAEWTSVGWISPYCEEHKPDNAVKFGEEYDWL